MQAPFDEHVAPRPASWWQRLHQALMPDYNRKSAVFWWLMVVTGFSIIAYCLSVVLKQPWLIQWQILGGAAVAAGAGFFPLRVGHAKNSFVAGEIFIFLILLMYSAEAAALGAAAEALVGSWRSSKRWTSRLASCAAAPIAMFSVGSGLHGTLHVLESYNFTNQGLVLALSVVASLLYFTVSLLLVTTPLRLKRSEPFVLNQVFNNVTWIGITYAGSASIAALLYLSFKQSGVGVLLAGAPVLVMLLATLHYYFRQQETQHSAQKSKIDAAMREADLAARHMREMAESERRFHSAFTHASIGMALVTGEGRVLQANLALENLLGYSASELISHDFTDRIVPDEQHLLRTQLQRADRHEVEAFGAELNCLHKDGRDVCVSLHCSFFSEPHSTAPCLILQIQDITARRVAESQLHHIAFHDGLTGLPNRRRFNQLLDQAVLRHSVSPVNHFAVMFIDCDRFKYINDSMGHAVGDDFLNCVAQRVQERVRPSDVVARLGGDEFGVLLHNVESTASVTALAERLLHALRQPMMVDDVPISSSVSIGITLSQYEYDSRENMLRDADVAMYRAKTNGKDRFVLFDEGMRAATEHRAVLESDLRQAIAKETLTIAYQPLFSLRTGEIRGFEALCRWNHPVMGPIAPSTFIPMAEENGCIVLITDFMLRHATKQLVAWQKLHPMFADLHMHVNVSANDIANSEFINRVTRALAASGLHPEYLVAELTENILMDGIEGGYAVLDQLRALGVELAIDDFGTGYSSLASLSRLPINSLKVDASFVRDLKADSKQAEVVRAIVTLGNTLGKQVIAEGIETDSQMAVLDEMGCEGGQGYLLSHPLAADEVTSLLNRLQFAHPQTPDRYSNSGFASLTQH